MPEHPGNAAPGIRPRYWPAGIARDFIVGDQGCIDSEILFAPTAQDESLSLDSRDIYSSVPFAASIPAGSSMRAGLICTILAALWTASAVTQSARAQDELIGALSKC